jgi:acyl-coenzyme A thioesterase PaaI-like protein
VSIEEKEQGPIASSHEGCFACGPNNKNGLGLTFRPSLSGGVEATFYCDLKYQGYPGFLQGGVIATLLDSAMIHCLFQKGIMAMTGRMYIQFKKPVRMQEVVQIKASMVEQRGPVYRLSAEVIQEELVCAKSSATFMQIPKQPP